jgi:hypothetical protein
MLPASAGTTAVKVFVCVFCIMLFVNPPPLGVREKCVAARARHTVSFDRVIGDRTVRGLRLFYIVRT